MLLVILWAAGIGVCLWVARKGRSRLTRIAGMLLAAALLLAPAKLSYSTVLMLEWWAPLIVWAAAIGLCMWRAVKGGSIIGRVVPAVLVPILAVVGYIWLTVARPIPNPSAEEAAAAGKALEELIEAWCAEDWHEVWDRTASLGKVEDKREKYVKIWKSSKAELFPSGVTLDQLQEAHVYRPAIGVLKIFLILTLPHEKADSPEDIDKLTAQLRREGLVCLAYRLQGKPYLNIIVNEEGVWRPIMAPFGVPADFLDEPLARAGDKL